MRVQRVRKPTRADADYSQLFFFDEHYPMSVLYCQEICHYAQLAIPRLVGSACPHEEEDGGEPHARHKLTLFSCLRCPGKLACADPMLCRPFLMPSDAPDDPKIVEAKATILKSETKPAAQSSSSRQVPKFLPAWKARKAEIAMKADIAARKEHLARKIAVIADTTTMKDHCRCSDPATRRALCLRPLLLRHILAPQFDKHIDQMPYGLVHLVDLIASFDCGQSCYHPDEQVHLVEFAALQMKKYNDTLDMDILVRKKPFRCSWSVGNCSLFLSRSASNNSRDVSNDTNLEVNSVYANTPAATSTIREATVFIGICTAADSDMLSGLFAIFCFILKTYVCSMIFLMFVSSFRILFLFTFTSWARYCISNSFT